MVKTPKSHTAQPSTAQPNRAPSSPPGVIRLEQAVKYKTALRYTLAGMELPHAQRALEHALRLHQGMRKDGVTPEWAHPVRVAMHVLTLHSALGTREQKDHILAAALLHDVVEDKPESEQTLSEAYTPEIGKTVNVLSRKRWLDPQFALSKQEYYGDMEEDRGAPIIKVPDRVQNFHSMVGVFSHAKQLEYLAEAQDHILPMLSRARRRWPELRMVNENMRLTLEAQMLMLEARLNEREGTGNEPQT